MLAKRFNIQEVVYFSSNITLNRIDVNSIIVNGNYSAGVKLSDLSKANLINGFFETVLLDNSISTVKIKYEDAKDYDDQVGSNGDIDIGEISSQYLGLEIFWTYL